MTQEQKELLMKDLCARVTNGVICSIYREDDEGFGWRDAECKGYFQTNHSYEFYFEDVVAVDNIENIKPYLRPMSSMTDEEYLTIYDMCWHKDVEFKTSVSYWRDFKTKKYIPYFMYNSNQIDYLTSHHFDYRDLIPMGLALEAAKDMYKI